MSGTSNQPQPQSSSAAAMQEIVRWSAGLVAWQRDALRRLCQQEILSDQDLAELEEFCRRPYETSSEPMAKMPEPVSLSHVRTDAGGLPVALKSIKDVANVNALADSQVLKFRDSGLTIVFGGNGSGKSGYARVLKRACRARHTDFEILSNVYQAVASDPATATLHFSIGGRSESDNWTDGTPAADALSAISVFDSACAVVHVEKTTNVAYTPAALDLLERLAKTCRKLRQRFVAEQDDLKAATPVPLVIPKCRPNTKVGKLVAALSASSTITAFEQLAVLGEAESKRLEALRNDLANDPRKVAEQLRLKKQRLLQTVAKVESLNTVVSNLAVDALKQSIADSAAKAEAARVAAEELFENEPLPRVGSDTWRALWDAARKYSDTEAYPIQIFPVVNGESRCVLCQQELAPDAAVRLTRFETFVKENAQKAAQDAKQGVQRTRAAIQAANVVRREQADAIGQVRDELESPAAADELRKFLTVARWRRRLLLRTSKLEAWPALPELPSAPVAGLKALEAGLNTRISELQDSANTEARRLLEQELQELEDRVWVSSVLRDVRDDIARRKKLAIVSSASGDAETTGITTKSTALAKKLVTSALRDSFTKEVERLGVTRLRVELIQTTSQYGVPKFKVSLIAKPAAEVGLILSEGEYRCIALAAFLSELATADDQSGIVFDDPVSSLDHDYRQTVAKRLAEESIHRQVIVFTHDIVFLTQLDEEARLLSTVPFYQSVGRGDDRSGFCYSDPPMKVRPVLDAVDGLEKLLKQVTQAYVTGHMDAWWRQAKGIAGDLRDLWERAVEQALSPVYSRFDYKVDTKNLVKVTVLTDSDCKAMRAAFGRCSKLQHSEPAAAGTSPPKPQDLQNEIDELRNWMTSVQSRQAAVS